MSVLLPKSMQRDGDVGADEPVPVPLPPPTAVGDGVNTVKRRIFLESTRKDVGMKGGEGGRGRGG